MTPCPRCPHYRRPEICILCRGTQLVPVAMAVEYRLSGTDDVSGRPHEVRRRVRELRERHGLVSE